MFFFFHNFKELQKYKDKHTLTNFPFRGIHFWTAPKEYKAKYMKNFVCELFLFLFAQQSKALLRHCVTFFTINRIEQLISAYLKVLSHIKYPRESSLIVWVAPHVPLGHRMHDECPDHSALTLIVPGIMQH